MNNSGITSVTHMNGEDGKPVPIDSVEWMKINYFVNMQDEVEEEQEPEKAPTMARARRKSPKSKKPAPISKAEPKAVGDELVNKAHQEDLKRRNLK